MAFQKFYCSECGLEIYYDEVMISGDNNDVYHGYPYDCYPHDKQRRDWLSLDIIPRSVIVKPTGDFYITESILDVLAWQHNIDREGVLDHLTAQYPDYSFSTEDSEDGMHVSWEPNVLPVVPSEEVE